jgi:Serine dehydrogenase proteinase
VFLDRKKLYRKLEADRKSTVIAYVTGDRRGLETKISPEVVDLFVHHLDHIGVVDKLTLFLYTRGGDTLAAWSLINLLRIFTDDLEIIVPSKAHSAGTLLCLGADSIMMTKQAALGPIDPSVHTPLNPQIPGAAPNAKVPVSVESINGFLEFARQTLGNEADLTQVFIHLANNVNPLVLGDAFRARGQIRMLASRLLMRNHKSKTDIDKILSFLCSESGSHDYTINRREGRNELGLPIVNPNDDQYRIIKTIYDDIASELDFALPYDPNVLLGGSETVHYALPRALIESRKGGSHVFQSEGVLTRQQVQVQPTIVQQAIRDERKFDGWRHRNA